MWQLPLHPSTGQGHTLAVNDQVIGGQFRQSVIHIWSSLTSDHHLVDSKVSVHVRMPSASTSQRPNFRHPKNFWKRDTIIRAALDQAKLVEQEPREVEAGVKATVAAMLFERESTAPEAIVKMVSESPVDGGADV